MKVLTFSTRYPNGHPKATKDTHFVDKILLSLVDDKTISKSKCVELARLMGINEHHPLFYIDTIDQYGPTLLKHHTIRAGSRFKAGDMASLRVWSDKPYRSKQIEFAQVEVKKVWAFSISHGNFSIDTIQTGSFIPDSGLQKLANNDGLHVDDFWSWFMIHPKKKEQQFHGQIISWSDKIEY